MEVGRLVSELKKQNRDQIQICIIDDGSKDNTFEQLEKMDLPSNFEIYKKAHSGVSETRNYGILKAKGQYITFVDADDKLSQDFITKFLNILKKKIDPTIILFGVNIKKDRFIYNKNIAPLIIVFYNSKRLIDVGIHAKFYKLEFLKKNAIKFPKELSIGEDLIFNILCLVNAKTIFLSKNKIYFYLTPHTMGTYKNQALENEQLFQKLLANYVSKIKNKSEIMDYYHITGICYLTLAYFSHGNIFNSLKQLKILANNKYYSKALKNKNFNKIIGKNILYCDFF